MMHLLGIMWTNHERPEKRRCEMVDKWWLYAEIYVITDRAFRNATLTKLKIYALWVACQNQVRKMLVSVPSLAAIVMIALLWRVYNHLHLSRLEASQDPPLTSNNHAPQQIIHSSGLQVVNSVECTIAQRQTCLLPSKLSEDNFDNLCNNTESFHQWSDDTPILRATPPSLYFSWPSLLLWCSYSSMSTS